MKRSLIILLLLFTTLVTSAQVSATIDSDGSTLFYRCFGKGDPLLIINGGPGMNSDGFAVLAKHFATGRQAIIYDQRGTGRSVMNRVDPSTITMDLMVADMENLRRHLQIDRWDILGHSFGGMLASYYATVHPEHIRSLVLSSSGGINLGLLDYVSTAINAKLSAAQQQAVRYWTNKISEGDTSHATRLQRGMNLAPAYVDDPKNIPAIAERLTQGNARINNLVWDDLRKIKFDCAAKLSTVSFPVLIIQGRQDIISAATAQQAKLAFKNSRLVFVEHCGHYGWLDNPGNYFASVDGFLGAVKQ